MTFVGKILVIVIMVFALFFLAVSAVVFTTEKNWKDEVANQKNATYGYDANNDAYVDMFKAGIVDPLRVTRNALQNAASIAGLMLTTEVMVTRIDEDDKKKPVTGAIA